MVECQLRGTGDWSFNPRPWHTKVMKNSNSFSLLGTQTSGLELGLVDPVSGWCEWMLSGTTGYFSEKKQQMSHDMTKPTKWLCAQPGHLPSLIRVFAVHMKKAWVLSYLLSWQWRLIRLGGCPGWSESSLGTHSFCWFCHVMAHILLDRPIQ